MSSTHYHFEHNMGGISSQMMFRREHRRYIDFSLEEIISSTCGINDAHKMYVLGIVKCYYNDDYSCTFTRKSLQEIDDFEICGRRVGLFLRR